MSSPSHPQQPYNITSPFGIQQSGRAAISSYSSLSGWNGVSNSTATSSSSTSSLNLGSTVHPTAPAFTNQGRSDSLTSGSGYRHEILRQDWPPASIRVDEMHKSVLANPQNIRDPELLAGSDSLPGHRQGSGNNQRAGEYSSTHLSELAPVFPPRKEKVLNRDLPKQSQVRSKAARVKRSLPRPSKKRPPKSQSFDSPSKFLSALLEMIPNPMIISCPYRIKHSSNRPCSLATVFKKPFPHWLVHMRDELKAIRFGHMELQHGQIVNTDVKMRIAERINTEFCPGCQQTFSGPQQVREHVKRSRECSKLARCQDCVIEAEPRLECAECAELQQKLICKTYLDLAMEIGYGPPVYLDRYNRADERAVQQDLDKRECGRWLGAGWLRWV
ncbi:hypothetical protein BU17DRAFT_65011 [Hysterangium stoloniferum]|nr:hypothetical protein BU17DRAFT_65011 [Hysterangium stoloniferum]